MNGGLPQYLARSKELIIMIIIVYTLADRLADDLATTIMLGKIGIIDILQGGLIFYCDDLLKVCVDDLL